MFAQLGEHIFEGLKSPSSLNASYAVRYGRVPLVNEKDVLQLTGDELDEIKITIQYSIEFADPKTEIDALKQSMKSGEVLPFILGDGTIVGKYVITNVEVNSQKYSPIGHLEAATISLNLLEYAAGEAPEPKGIAVTSGDTDIQPSAPESIGEQVPAAEPPATPKSSPASSIAKSISKAKSKVNAIKKVGDKAKDKAISVKRAVQEARQLADDAKEAYTAAKTKVETTVKIIERAIELPTSLDEAIKYAENLAKLDNTIDISVLQNNINQLSQSADKVTSSATPVVSFSATREGED